MRWLLVTARHHPSQGGIGAYAWNLLHASARCGWSIDLVTRPGFSLEKMPPGVTVHPVSTPDDEPAFASRIPRLRALELIRPYRYGLWSLAVARRLSELPVQADAIEFVDCQAEGLVSLSSDRVRSRFRDVPMIISAHTPMFIEEAINEADPDRFGRPIYHQWERRAIEAADGVIAPSRGLADRLSRTDAAVMPLPLNADIRPAAPGVIDRQMVRAVGTLQPRKGFDVWMRSLNIIFEQHVSVHAELIGLDTPTGPAGSSFARSLLELIEPPFRNRVAIRGPLSHAEIVRAIASAALVIVPSRFEAFGFVAAEALQCGRPIVISDAVGLREHVSGLPTFPARDHDALAERQLHLLENLEAAEQDAEVCGRQLMQACSIERHLAARSSMICLLRGQERASLTGDQDAMEAMEAFLADVERREESAEHAAASSSSSAAS